MNISKLFDYAQPLVAAATILVIGLAGMVWYGAHVFYQVKLANDTIEVTGSAKESVVSDLGRLTISLDTKSGLNDQEAAAKRLQAGVDKIVTFLKEQGLTEIETPAGNTNPNFYYPQNSEPVQTGFQLNRSVVVRSSEVAKLGDFANNAAVFAGSGYNVSIFGLELTYSQLDEKRVSLLTQAIKDATDRANAIAINSGRKVGKLRNASGGVVQVLPAGGVDISDYGTYDTASLNKDIMVTARVTFGLE